MKYQIDQSGKIEYTSKPTKERPEVVVKYDDLLKWIV